MSVYSTTTVETSDDDDELWIILVICGAALFITVGVFVVIYKLKTRPHQSLSDKDSGLDEKLVQPGVSLADAKTPQLQVDIETLSDKDDELIDSEGTEEVDVENAVEAPADGNDVLVPREAFNTSPKQRRTRAQRPPA